ncbi:hypothetical protein Tco_1017510 [Tanacetum coccineum]|uniref:Uncharacterized protein n=1 Tax=Tanacetum coccineum TaxID=301880 RepID=A0ABQ5FSY1_9ASTR
MADLTFADSHNMVAYLEKSKANANFAKIVDFLNASSIRYALTFWQTAAASTLDKGEMEITTTIDGKVKIVTEASIRRHLKLEEFWMVKDQQSQLSPITHLQGRKITQIVEEEGKYFGTGWVFPTLDIFYHSNVPVTTAGAEISTVSLEVKTVGDYVDDIATESLVYIRRSAAKTKDKGKGIMEESESAMTKTKRQQEQERLGLETTMRLQEEFNEEERQRIARVHEAARSFTEEEWEDIRERVEASEELVQRLQIEEREKYSEDDQAKMLQKPDELSQEELQQLIIIVPEEGMNIEALQTKYPIIDWEVYTEDLRMYWKIIRVGNHTEIWVELKRLFEPDADDELWKSQKHLMDITHGGP